MAGENTLSAPTEGLGQNVTFAQQGGGGVPQLQLAGQGAVQTGIGGGGVGIGGTQAQGIQQEGPSPMVTALMNLGGTVLAKKQERKNNEAFLRGMQRTAAGEAVADIAREQPWYAGMFGEGDAAEGARWYASHTVANNVASEFDSMMPELRKLPPDAARVKMQQLIESRMTGDTVADTAIVQQLTQVVTPSFKRQAKEHIAYQNEEGVKALTASMFQGAQRLQDFAKGAVSGTYSAEDSAQAIQTFVEAQVNPGLPEHLYAKTKADGLEYLATTGKFHAFDALDRAGFVDSLPQDMQESLRAKIATAQNRTKAQFALTVDKELARIDVFSKSPPPGTVAEDVLPMVKAVDDRLFAEHGIRNYFSGEERAALMSRSAVHIIQSQENEAKRRFEAELRAAEKAERQGDESAKQAAKIEFVRNALRTGNLAHAMTVAGITQDQLGYIALQDLNTQFKDDPAGRIGLLTQIAKSGVPVPAVAKHYEGLVNGMIQDSSQGIMPDRFYTMFKEYSSLAEVSTAAADMAFGNYADRFEKMRQDVKVMPPQEAYMGFLRGDKRREKLNQEDFKKSIKEASVTLQPKWFGMSHELNRASQYFVMRETEDKTARLVAIGYDVATATRRSLEAAPGLEVMGGHAWRNDPKQTKLAHYLTSTTGPNGKGHIPTDRVADAFKDAIDEGLYGDSGILTDTSDYVTVSRMQDKAGVPQFKVMAILTNGGDRQFVLSGADVFDLHRRGEVRKKQARQFPAGVQANGKPVRDLTRISSFIDFKE